MEASQRPAGNVVINIYDLLRHDAQLDLGSVVIPVGGALRALNTWFRPAAFGAFHAGVAVYGSEYGFGKTDDAGSGCFVHHPRRNVAYSWREEIEMGPTALTKRQVDEAVLALAQDWRGNTYELVGRNCVDYCSALCAALGVGEVPGWVNNLANSVLPVVRVGNQIAAATSAAAESMSMALCLPVGGSQGAAPPAENEDEQLQRAIYESML